MQEVLTACRAQISGLHEGLPEGRRINNDSGLSLYVHLARSIFTSAQRRIPGETDSGIRFSYPEGCSGRESGRTGAQGPKWMCSCISDNGLKTSKIDAFSPLYELESALQCALMAIGVTESQ